MKNMKCTAWLVVVALSLTTVGCGDGGGSCGGLSVRASVYMNGMRFPDSGTAVSGDWFAAYYTGLEFTGNTLSFSGTTDNSGFYRVCDARVPAYWTIRANSGRCAGASSLIPIASPGQFADISCTASNNTINTSPSSVTMGDFHYTTFTLSPSDGQPINSSQTPEVRLVDSNGNVCGYGSVYGMSGSSMDVRFEGSYWLNTGNCNIEVWCSDANGYYGILGVGSVFVDSN
jgi:hypothetical protein